MLTHRLPNVGNICTYACWIDKRSEHIIDTGAAQVLEIERDDLEILVLGHPGTEISDAILFDPMSGGSSLTDQMIARFDEVRQAALAISRGCPSRCVRAYIDCLYTFRNGFFHVYSNRTLVADLIDERSLT